MALKITDPHSFLKNLITKKGKSELDGIYLPHVNVVAEALTDYGYSNDSYNAEREVENFLRRESAKWNDLLVGARRYDAELVHHIVYEQYGQSLMLMFVTEGNEISLSVSIPVLDLDDLVNLVTFQQFLLKEVAHFVGKSPTQIRFVAGVAMLRWQALVESGHVTEVDVGF